MYQLNVKHIIYFVQLTKSSTGTCIYTDRQTDTYTYAQTDRPSVDAAVSIVLVSAVAEDVPDVSPLATGTLGPESVVVVALLVAA